MSGLEIAGVLLSAFPLLITSLKHWRDVAKVGSFWWRVRKDHTACLRWIRFHEILYKRNLKELLIPVLTDASEVKSLIIDLGGRDWSSKALQERLEERLHESYSLDM
ncbi:hypothetical protein BU25DRAFT_416114 [Macroventuria anomochaeta]|uniref:Uncharacterized protein n=1 Tax=Macroventuria anomochaeta TaxID=301207 RepID=A0ACB6RID5_9PLEO|nr:uncharacterized protein BU25DRAFT_416114 [Macroventuria anomochaeta]KAF2621452.1 hypothetical protein BU25DRAFT_416114 [Macroventuria anomochaeta]